jgi:hypothetical protein
MPVPLVGAVAAFFTFLGSATARMIAEKVFLFLAVKTLLVAVVATLLPVVLNNLLADWMADGIAMMEGFAVSGGLPGGMQFTGFMAWLIDCFKLSDCLAIVVTATQLHIMLKFLPFSPVK